MFHECQWKWLVNDLNVLQRIQNHNRYKLSYTKSQSSRYLCKVDGKWSMAWFANLWFIYIFLGTRLLKMMQWNCMIWLQYLTTTDLCTVDITLHFVEWTLIRECHQIIIINFWYFDHLVVINIVANLFFFFL